MDYNSDLLPEPVIWVSSVGFALVFYQALISAPWKRLRISEQLHVLLGGCVSILLLWTIKAGVLPGLNYHLLGATALTLMLGWQLAYLSLTLVVVLSTLNGFADWGALATNVMVMVGIPIAITQGLLLLAQARLPCNIFVYVFVNAFLAAAVGMMAVGLTTATLMLLSGVYDLEVLVDGYLVYLPLFCFPEANINGMLMVLLAVYRPQWVVSFEDKRYLR
jgi:uncharacterized membrane protein